MLVFSLDEAVAAHLHGKQGSEVQVLGPGHYFYSTEELLEPVEALNLMITL